MVTTKYNYSVMKNPDSHFSQEQMDLIEDHTELIEYRLFFRFLRTSGRRVTEVLGREEYINNYRSKKTKDILRKKYFEVKGITPNDIRKDGLVIFNILKQHEAVRAPKAIDKKTMELLKDYIAMKGIKDDEPIFKFNRFQAHYRLRKACRNANIRLQGGVKPHLHMYRHSFCIHIIKTAQTPQALRMLQQHLHHSKLDITAHYLQFSQKEKKEMIEKTFRGI